MKFPFLSYANWYPLGELNPCFQVENLASLSIAVYHSAINPLAFLTFCTLTLILV